MVEIEGPLCAYWDVEDASICGHGSCYEIAFAASQIQMVEDWVKVVHGA